MNKALCQHRTFPICLYPLAPFRSLLFGGDFLAVQCREIQNTSAAGAWPQFYASEARLRLRLGMNDWSSGCGLMVARFDHIGKPTEDVLTLHSSMP